MSELTKKTMPHLGDSSADKTAAILRSVVGVVPWAGAAFSEIVTQIIPNQRVERIEKFLVYLAEELDVLKINNAEEHVKRSENVDFFEDGAYQAVRAMSDERTRYIAKCVADGIASQDVDKTRQKRVLRLLQLVDDEEILLLYGYFDLSGQGGKIFSDLRPSPAVIGSSSDVISNQTLFSRGIENLENLGLVTTYYSHMKRGEYPEFDPQNGTFKGGHKKITWLGRMLLKKIGLIETEI